MRNKMEPTINGDEFPFKGVWIPKEIILSRKTTPIETIFLAIINDLDREEGCAASNGYFAKFFDLSKERCSQIIGSLKKKNLIDVEQIMEGKQIKRRVIRIKRYDY